MNTEQRVGVIGLGAMGFGIAQTLRRNGFTVYACDARAGVAAGFARDGGVACDTPRAVAGQVEHIVSVVVNAAQTEDVLFGPQGAAAAMRPGHAFVMCSTVDAAWSARLGERLAGQGVLYVDAPISGGAARAASGQMTVMASATDAAWCQTEALLHAMAGTVYRLGKQPGMGSRVKTIHQLLAGVHIAAAAEAMALGLREGVDAGMLYDVITHSAGNSWMFENRMARVLAGDYAARSAVDIFVKDLGLVLDAGRQKQFPLPLAATAHQMFLHAASAGHGAEDDSAIIKTFPGIVLPQPPRQAPPSAAASGLLLGCIADDFTGASDLAGNLAQAGLRVVQAVGVPQAPLIDAEAHAVVVALKSRTIAPAEAVQQSLAALRWLQQQGARQIYFKYCSTFDSTEQGNIGPVTEALMDALDCPFTIATPAFPDNQRSVFQGHLFVGDVLLSESGMQDHPLTPMRDSNLVRVLQAQTRRKVGLIDCACVARGAHAIRARMAQLKAQGVGIAIVDAARNEDLALLAPALADLPLVTAASGLATALPANFSAAASDQTATRLPAASGGQAVVSGSCSQASLGQVRDFVARGHAALALDPLRLAQNPAEAIQATLAWAGEHLAAGPVLVYSSADAASVRSVQQRLGTERAAALVETALAAIARGLVQLGVRQLVVAGGETSGACVQALGVEQLRIGRQIAPGVPWCHAELHLPEHDGPQGVHLALKSGNFGGPDFFHQAFAQLA